MNKSRAKIFVTGINAHLIYLSVQIVHLLLSCAVSFERNHVELVVLLRPIGLNSVVITTVVLLRQLFKRVFNLTSLLSEKARNRAKHDWNADYHENY